MKSVVVAAASNREGHAFITTAAAKSHSARLAISALLTVIEQLPIITAIIV
jgi:hypothetical protein